MAGRPKKATTENIEITENVSVDDTGANDTPSPTITEKPLEKENEELKAQLKMLLDKLASLEEKADKEIDLTQEVKKEDAYTDINPLKPIKVISLIDGGVSLRTNATGTGKTFRFDKFGHSISITYSDIQDIIATDRSFIEDGAVYICNEDVVRNNYLDDHYNKFLTVDKITNILTFSVEDIIEMVSNTTETIQETIISLITKKIINNEYVDMNKVNAIGKVCKNPCDIPTLALQKRIH